MRFFTSVQDDTYTNNVILSEAKNLFLEVLKSISVLKELSLLFYQYLSLCATASRSAMLD